ncbi:hypothetical protein DV738_g4972, partial [Chaetothyriales sp. CBS 135597]
MAGAIIDAVGVASRGKLRGLALPIAGTQLVTEQLRSARLEKQQALTTSSQDADDTSSAVSGASSGGRWDAEFGQQPTYILNDPSPATNDWQQEQNNSPYQPPMSETEYEGRYGYLNIPSPYASSTYAESTGHGSPLTQGFLTAYAQTQFISHTGIPSPALSASPAESVSYFLQTQYRHVSTAQRIPQPTSHPQADPSFSFNGSPIPGKDGQGAYSQHDEPYVPGEMYWGHLQPFYNRQMNSPADSGSISLETDDQDSIEGMSLGTVDSDYVADTDSFAGATAPSLVFTALPLAPTISTGLGIGKTPRMQFLIKYYAQVISPVIVAFDGPSNPYRSLILPLAAEDEILQHALAALAASNLRQRQATGMLSTGKTAPARKSSIAYLTLTDEERQRSGPLSRQHQLREEEFHKNYAIKSLNLQFADPVARKRDSVLATLLILCLFHICDSGVEKFQIQFAGVKKLLQLRQDDSRRETQWFTRMFALFDVIAASVNDREGQLQGQHLNVSAAYDGEWSLSNLAGCDEELFKLLAKLGRLNILSQGKQVESSPPVVCRPFSHLALVSNGHGPLGGPGWARLAADEDLFHTKTIEPSLDEQFWREWREIRHSLQTWRLDPLTTIQDRNASALSDLTTEQCMDLVNISESFRYAALLYTERLAHPNAANTDANITAWVKQGLHFIRLVKSDVYLLWPLFIIGAECVDPADLDLIRLRCIDIYKDSGFLPPGFRFTKIMELERNKGEYMVV